MSDPVLDALARTLESEPENGPLWLHYAELLLSAGEEAKAIDALRRAADLDAVRVAATTKLSPLLRAGGELAEALIRVEAALEKEPDPGLYEELGRIKEARGMAEEPLPTAAPEVAGTPQATPIGGDAGDPREWADQFDWGELRTTFEDVVGLDEVKRQLRLRVLAPLENPEMYEAFGRKAGGGLLLYGPPGCGKSFIARATAGELGARFVVVSIHDIVDKYHGESEKAVHALFEDARASKPTVLFFDEFDALGATRRGDSQFWKTLVDQFLQEMDGLAGENEGVLIFGATNAPWNVDSAFRRPGRFDRVLFVAPPDEKARAELLRRQIEKLPKSEAIDTNKLARRTELFSGADLLNLCSRASEDALERSLDSGKVHPVGASDFERVLAEVSSTTLEWMASARNHAKYANEGRQYDDLVAYLKAVKRW